MTVVEPFMSTIAGSGTMLVHLEKRGETVALDFNGVAPTRAHERMFRLIGGISDGLFPWPRVEGAANEYGHRAVAVPGSVAGLTLALERYGTMDLAAYEVRVSAPLTERYRDLDLALAPGATGGITALEILNILEQWAPARVGGQTTEGLHRRAQAVRRAFADRFQLLGDPAVVKAPWAELASKPYARAIAAELQRPAARPAGDRAPAA